MSTPTVDSAVDASTQVSTSTVDTETSIDKPTPKENGKLSTVSAPLEEEENENEPEPSREGTLDLEYEYVTEEE